MKSKEDVDKQLDLGFGAHEPSRETSKATKKPRRAKPGMYLSQEWRERRDAVIARSPICEWCGRAFTGEVIASVHHIGGDYRPFDGSGDAEAYCEMRDDEVVVICRGCHWFWHLYGLKPGDPQLTCQCGKWKEPQYEVCTRCWRASKETKVE